MSSASITAAMQPRSQNTESVRQTIRLLRHCIARVQG
jgi:hypothetical protein